MNMTFKNQLERPLTISAIESVDVRHQFKYGPVLIVGLLVSNLRGSSVPGVANGGVISFGVPTNDGNATVDQIVFGFETGGSVYLNFQPDGIVATEIYGFCPFADWAVTVFYKQMNNVSDYAK